MKNSVKSVLLVVLIAFFAAGCGLVTGPDDPSEGSKPTTVKVDYVRYVAGGSYPSAADRPSIYFKWNSGYDQLAENLTKQGGENYSFVASINTLDRITGCIRDPKMYDKNNNDYRSAEEVALYVWLDGKEIVRISNGCTSPWSGTFKFYKKNDGTIVMLKE
jgi:hypothetical protein